MKLTADGWLLSASVSFSALDVEPMDEATRRSGRRPRRGTVSVLLMSSRWMKRQPRERKSVVILRFSALDVEPMDEARSRMIFTSREIVFQCS